MTDSTKNLFDAPWYVFSSPDDEITVIENESGRVLAELDDVKNANRLARLPELYDALMAVMKENCGLVARCGLEYCPACDISDGCKARERFELLRKVRDGE